MDLRTKAALSASALSLLLFIFIWLKGSILIEQAATFGIQSDRDMAVAILTKSRTQLIAMVDQSVSMTTSLVFGLFILLGFATRAGSTKDTSCDRFDLVAGAGFLVCAFLAIYVGFATRSQAIELLAKPILDVEGLFIIQKSLSSNLGTQAFIAGLTFVFTVFLTVRSILDVRKPETGSGTVAIDSNGKVTVDSPDAMP